ncbi:MAG: flavodoxin domain-containing protein [bacterium]|nr:flavodoxin domain-containing protein [bacterium]
MTILIVFATNSGGTQEAVGLVEETLKSLHFTVSVKPALQALPDDITSSNAIILASPSWDYGNEEGQPHEDFFPFMKLCEGKVFEGKPFAILGLGDSSYTKFCGAVDHLETFVKTLHGTLVVPSLRIDGYYSRHDNPDKVKAWTNTLVKTFPQ